jgi:hypothetical protein
MIDGLPVLDAVVHACNMDAVNYANRFAAPLCDLVYGSVPATARPGYAPTRAQFYRDWSIRRRLSRCSSKHVLPIFSFKDGLCSLEKAIEAQARWPHRFRGPTTVWVSRPIE